MPADVYRDPFRRRRVHYDAFVNALAGFGTSRDKLGAGFWSQFSPLDWPQLEALFYGDDIAARIVETKPDHMLRRGFTIEEASNADELTQQCEDLQFEQKLLESMIWARLYGGAALIVGADDGLDPQYPLLLERVRGVRFLNVIDRRFVIPISYYQNPAQPNYGEPEVFQVTTSLGGESSFVHESRMLRFFGTRTDIRKRQELGGWGYSVLQRVYEVVRQFTTAYAAAAQLTIDAGQAVFTIAGLMQMISGDDTANDGTDANTIAQATFVQRRMAAVDMQRSSGRAIVLDKDGEEYHREPVQVTGVADLIDRFQQRLAGSADMPVTLLMGRSPAGMNATGESDLTQWNNACDAGRRKEVRPAILRFLQVLTAGKFDGEICFPPLTDPDPKKDADVALVRAQTWKLYSVDMGAIHPEQVALAEFADRPVEIDVAVYEKAIKMENAKALQEPQAPPPAPPENGNGQNLGQDPPPEGDPAAEPTDEG